MNQIDIKSSKYPYLLKQIKDPPKTLYFKGKWDTDIFKDTLSVVGSRRMTKYGEIITAQMIGSIAEEGITIVSGFMYGIDAEAHKAAVDKKGRTIAVMPCGVNRIHPEYQKDLYNKILKFNGLIISEYPGDTPPALWTYPRRNRIIAGLSPVLLVIEAGLKSGALITAKIAKKYSKKIYAVPGPLTSSVSKGTAMLIRDGASIVTGKEDLLLEYGKFMDGNSCLKIKKENLSRSQKNIIELLSLEEITIDEIIRKTNRSASETGSDLTVLSLKKIIILKEGKYYLCREDLKC